LLDTLLSISRWPNLISATESEFSAAVNYRQNIAIQQFFVQEFFFVMIIKSFRILQNLRERSFSDFVSALAIRQKQKSKLLSQNRPLLILVERKCKFWKHFTTFFKTS